MDRKTGIALLALVVVGGFFYFFGFVGGGFFAGSGVPGLDEGPVVDQRAIQSALLGSWQSTDDPRFTREFSATGTVTDRYEGQPGAEGTGVWTVFTADDAPAGLLFEPDPQAVYVQVVAGEETFYFAVVRLSDTELQMVYLDRGAVLSFIRMR